jgi:glycosyltransferase involved in cell wall biosynthesis
MDANRSWAGPSIGIQSIQNADEHAGYSAGTVLDVTVVIPMYNAAPTILRALDSIVAQTHQPTRIVIANDCSTDDSAEVVRRADVPNVVVVETEKNGGIAVARNRGAREAQTEWLAFLDADDWWEPTFLERTSAAITRFDADFASAGGRRERPDGSGMHVQVRLLPGRDDALDLTTDFWRIARRFRPVNASAVVMRRSLFESVGGFWERMRTGEDTCMWVNLWLRGRFAFVNEPLAVSAVVAGSVSAQRLSYRAVRLSAACMLRGVSQAIRMRKPGTGWFVVFAAGRLVNLHSRWLLGHVRGRARPATS